MKKKLFVAIVACVCALACAFFIAACSDPDNHDHTWSHGWSNDATQHWHACTVEGCKEKSDTGVHDFERGICIICGYEAVSDVGQVSIQYSLNDEGTGYTVTGAYLTADTDLVIPASYQGKPVTAIGENAFRGSSLYTYIKSITLPDTITNAGGRYSFEHCDNLEKIYFAGNISQWCGIDGLLSLMSRGETLYINGNEVSGDLEIPEGVTSISEYAFSGCDAITSVTLPDGLTSIGGNAFEYCSGISSIAIPDSVTSIGSWAFNGCGLSTVRTPASLARPFGDYAIKHLEITSGATVGEIMKNVDTLESVTLPASVTSVHAEAFRGCDALTSITVDANNPNYMSENGVLYNKTQTEIVIFPCGLDSITVPNSVTVIGPRTFLICAALKNVTLHSGVTAIGNYAFQGCAAIENISLPNSISSIGNSAFAECAALRSIALPQNLTTLGTYAFYNCYALTQVEFPQNLTTISYCSFLNCTKLTSVTIPANITNIANGAFSKCSKLASVTFESGSNLRTIESNAFTNCTLITNITLPDSLTSVAGLAFTNCPIETATIPAVAAQAVNNAALTTVVITSGTRIENNAFASAAALESVTLPEGLLTIGDFSFGNCAALENLSIPSTVTSVAANSFKGCDSLIQTETGVSYVDKWVVGYDNTPQADTLIVRANTVNAVPGVFDGCAFETANIPAHLISRISKTDLRTAVLTGSGSIPNEAFRNNTVLRSVSIVNGIAAIGNRAFYGCSSLKAVRIGNSVTSIGSQAFAGCCNLAEITLPESVTTIGSSIFDNKDVALTVYCEAEARPSGWASDWDNVSGLILPVVWNCRTNRQDASGREYAVIGGIRYGIMNGTATVWHQVADTVSIVIPSSIVYNNATYSVTATCSTPFTSCKAVLESVTIPSSVTAFGYMIFSGCTALKDVYFVGTEEQWNAIVRVNGWNSDCPDCTLHFEAE